MIKHALTTTKYMTLCVIVKICIFLSISSVPSAPLDLKVTCTGPTSINITWSAPANANGILLQYNVYRGVNTKRLYKHKVTADPEIMYNSFPVTKLVQNVHNRIEVSAETRIGEGASTMPYYILMDNGTLFISPPSFVETINSTAIKLSWVDYGSVDPIVWRSITPGYIIYHNVTIEGQLSVNLSVMNKMSSHTHVFQGLMPFTYYGFSVSFYAYILEKFSICSAPSEIVVARTDEDCKISH